MWCTTQELMFSGKRADVSASFQIRQSKCLSSVFSLRTSQPKTPLCLAKSHAAAALLAVDGHGGRQIAAGLTVTASSQGSEEKMRAGETVFSLRVCFCVASGLTARMNHCNSAAWREYSKRAARCRAVKVRCSRGI